MIKTSRVQIAVAARCFSLSTLLVALKIIISLLQSINITRNLSDISSSKQL